MVDLFGFVGNGLLAICGIPLALASFIQGRTVLAQGEGSRVFIWCWWWGEILSLIYNIGELGSDGFLTMNYTINIVCVTIVLYYIYNPRGEGE